MINTGFFDVSYNITKNTIKVSLNREFREIRGYIYCLNRLYVQIRYTLLGVKRNIVTFEYFFIHAGADFLFTFRENGSQVKSRGSVCAGSVGVCENLWQCADVPAPRV